MEYGTEGKGVLCGVWNGGQGRSLWSMELWARGVRARAFFVEYGTEGKGVLCGLRH